jgi:hypothetical protein
MNRRSAVLLASFGVLAIVLSAGGAQYARAAPNADNVPPADRDLPQAEIFATSNTAIITDPGDPRLKTRLIAFEHQVDSIVRDGGAEPEGSTLLNGVFWSSSLQQATYERSREFEVTHTNPTQLHDIAHVISVQFHQESALTFELLPRTSPRVDALEVEVPGIDVRELHDKLVADPAARDHLQGGSVTLHNRLILIGGLSDLSLVQRFVTELGGTWPASTIRYGAWEFVA